MKYLILFILLISNSVSAEMVVMYLNTENTAFGIRPCEMVERGSRAKLAFYKFDAEPGSGGCHAEIPKEVYYKNFMFCGIGGERSSRSQYNVGECSIYPSGDNTSIIFSAMPGSGPRDEVYYDCTFVCETKNGYQPNFKSNVSE